MGHAQSEVLPVRRLADLLRQHRNRLGLSQAALGNRLGGYERRTVLRVEAGRCVPSERYVQAWLRWYSEDPEGDEVRRLSSQIRSRIATGTVEEAGLIESAHPKQRVEGQAELLLQPTVEDAMNRRELLRIFTLASTLMATSHTGRDLDWERLIRPDSNTKRLDSVALDDYEALNAHLWQVFNLSKAKATVFPLVRDQLLILVDEIHRTSNSYMYHRLCALTGDLFQLAGEVLFDGNRYTDAAHCYTLAAMASKEADAFDLWACALTRHSFIGVYERQFKKTVPMLELAAVLAKKGDSSLSTRYWVSAVQAQAFAGIGELDKCRRALQRAEQVERMEGNIQNGGWLRFTGSRLAEERGACFVELRQSDLAEEALASALNQKLSARRHGSVLADLAMLGIQRRDLGQLLSYGDAALNIAHQTKSGVLGRKLGGLQGHLAPLLQDDRVRTLDREITALNSAFTSV